MAAQPRYGSLRDFIFDQVEDFLYFRPPKKNSKHSKADLLVGAVLNLRQAGGAYKNDAIHAIVQIPLNRAQRSTSPYLESLMKRSFLCLAIVLASCATPAATLIMNVARLNTSNGDRMQYRLPGASWITVDPAYGQHRVYNVANNLIVSVRVFNVYQQRTISNDVKATWRGNGGDADWFGNVRFNVYGTG